MAVSYTHLDVYKRQLYDRSDGFYRRQLILTTKDKPLSRVDDPDIAEKMAAEVEGILLWAFEGLPERLVTLAWIVLLAMASILGSNSLIKAISLLGTRI